MRVTEFLGHAEAPSLTLTRVGGNTNSSPRRQEHIRHAAVADFQPQVCAALGKPKLTKSELERASDQLVRLILKGCGVRGAA